jgi:hypothetical protein
LLSNILSNEVIFAVNSIERFSPLLLLLAADADDDGDSSVLCLTAAVVTPPIILVVFKAGGDLDAVEEAAAELVLVVENIVVAPVALSPVPGLILVEFVVEVEVAPTAAAIARSLLAEFVLIRSSMNLGLSGGTIIFFVVKGLTSTRTG